MNKSREGFCLPLILSEINLFRDCHSLDRYPTFTELGRVFEGFRLFHTIAMSCLLGPSESRSILGLLGDLKPLSTWLRHSAMRD